MIYDGCNAQSKLIRGVDVCYKGGSSSQKVTTNTIAEPPAFQKPYLEFGMNEAKNIYTGAPQITGYTTQTVPNPNYIAPSSSSSVSSSSKGGNWGKVKNSLSGYVGEPYADDPYTWGGASSYGAAQANYQNSKQGFNFANQPQYLTTQTPVYADAAPGAPGGKLDYYGGQLVADFQPEQQQAWDSLNKYISDTNGIQANATNALNGMLTSNTSDLVNKGSGYLSDVLDGKYLEPMDNASYKYLTDVMNGTADDIHNTDSFKYMNNVMNGTADNIRDTESFKYMSGVMNGANDNIRDMESYKYLSGVMNGTNNNIHDTAGYSYFNDVVNGKYLPPDSFEASTYAMDPFSYNPEANPYYDRIVERAMGQANSQASANGAYGSSDWLNLRGNAATDLYADQYNEERQWYENQLAQNKGLYEGRYQNERNLMNGAGNSLISADQNQNAQQINAGLNVAGLDESQFNRQQNAGTNLMGAEENQFNRQQNAGTNLMGAETDQFNRKQNAGTNLLGFYQGERNNQMQAAGMVPAMDQARYAEQQAALQLAPSINNMNLTNYSAMENIGLQKQLHEQDIINANKAKWDYEQMEPWTRLNLYQGAVNGNMGQSTSSTTNQPVSKPNPFTGGIGGALAGASLGSAIPGLGTGVGALAGGGLGLIGSFF